MPSKSRRTQVLPVWPQFVSMPKPISDAAGAASFWSTLIEGSVP